MFPQVTDLPVSEGFPDPLVLFAGQKIGSREEWWERRRPELGDLFRHYMYGTSPPGSGVHAETIRTSPSFLNGRATLKEVSLSLAQAGAPKLGLLLVIPNFRVKPAPVFLSLNFHGNHLTVAEDNVALTPNWVKDDSPGARENRATQAGRGAEAGKWAVAETVGRGYAFATVYCGDIDPDRNDFSDGVHPHYPRAFDWGTIAAWAWGLSRAVDYLVTDGDVDGGRIAVVGHSRLGKTALVAAAFDERIAMAIPHQAGCGGTAPSRGTAGESVEQINTAFPHWFNAEFKKFNDCPSRLPFDQHCLIALVAPRPVLLTNAIEDEWANPAGQFDMLKEADPVYRFLGTEGLADESMPGIGRLSSGRLGYYRREGGHAMRADDWGVFVSYADRLL